MSRICLTVQYDGSEYHGWQFQKSMPHLQTVQATLEAALSKIADHEVSVVCAGRTDRGVHALGQVVHFDTTAQRDLSAWVLGANSHLPDSVVVRTSQLVADDFHARFSALTRSYRYKIYNSKLPDVFANRLATWVKTKLDVPAMQIAAKYLIGEHDFSAFRASGCQAKTAVRNLELLDVTRNKHWIDVDLRANAFLYHMVRNIMGSLILVGKGFRPPEWVQDILLQKDRKLAADTASARGLYLTAVQYPDLIANNET
jgi:tRNA pseudouridine38-40 synthase